MELGLIEIVDVLRRDLVGVLAGAEHLDGQVQPVGAEVAVVHAHVGGSLIVAVLGVGVLLQNLGHPLGIAVLVDVVGLAFLAVAEGDGALVAVAPVEELDQRDRILHLGVDEEGVHVVGGLLVAVHLALAVLQQRQGLEAALGHHGAQRGVDAGGEGWVVIPEQILAAAELFLPARSVGGQPFLVQRAVVRELLEELDGFLVLGLQHAQIPVAVVVHVIGEGNAEAVQPAVILIADDAARAAAGPALHVVHFAQLDQRVAQFVPGGGHRQAGILEDVHADEGHAARLQVLVGALLSQRIDLAVHHGAVQGGILVVEGLDVGRVLVDEVGHAQQRAVLDHLALGHIEGGEDVGHVVGGVQRRHLGVVVGAGRGDDLQIHAGLFLDFTGGSDVLLNGDGGVFTAHEGHGEILGDFALRGGKGQRRQRHDGEQQQAEKSFHDTSPSLIVVEWKQCKAGSARPALLQAHLLYGVRTAFHPIYPLTAPIITPDLK